MTELRQYDPQQVIGTWATPLGSFDILDGRIDPGTFITPARNTRRWALENDGNNNSTRVKQPDRTASITVELSASSPTNAVLSRLAAIDDTTENVVGVLTLRDLSGDTLVVATGAFLEDVPDPSYGSERGTRSWVWLCARLDVDVGGHDLA
jgi:hypothetical protein